MQPIPAYIVRMHFYRIRQNGPGKAQALAVIGKAKALATAMLLVQNQEVLIGRSSYKKGFFVPQEYISSCVNELGWQQRLESRFYGSR